MLTNNLGYPRIGSKRELKKACEQYWSGKNTIENLVEVGKTIRLHNWNLQQESGIDLIPSNDFSFYDQVLDMSLTVGAIPKRYSEIKKTFSKTELYFAMARGYQKEEKDITAMEMTKWFDTNYHYIVPEFYKNQEFELFSTKIIDEFVEAKNAGIITKPVILGPISYLLLGKEKEEGFHRISLLEKLLPVYVQVLKELEKQGACWIQFDEPYLSLDLSETEQKAFKEVYSAIISEFPDLNIFLANYFDAFDANLKTVLSVPFDAIHFDLVRSPSELLAILDSTCLLKETKLSLGIVNGRNVWKNNFENSLALLAKIIKSVGEDRVLISSSCSLLHSPCDLDLENNEAVLSKDIKQWLAFARQKLEEISVLRELLSDIPSENAVKNLELNTVANLQRKESKLIHNSIVKKRVEELSPSDAERSSIFSLRKTKQKIALQLPLFPTTTIGSFPQTKTVRSWRAKYKKGEITAEAYSDFLKEETEAAIFWQEDIGLDVLVHGEFERNDMVEYFGEQLSGFVFTKFGWVQSYGSRCVKPPIIYGDVQRPEAMTVNWAAYAQSITEKLVKGMLTGPVTILQWSFVRDDQPRSETCQQIAFAIRDEVVDLEKAGIKIIQVDEPAIREGLPLRKSAWKNYLQWAIEAFKIATSGVEDETQIHTHMCYSDFNDIIEDIARMDADVITIECSRSQMDLLDAFSDFKYPNEIGPGVYDIHSPRVPSRAEMTFLLKKAMAVIPAEQLWVNPDCGLKTRHWQETKAALIEMVSAAKEVRATVTELV